MASQEHAETGDVANTTSSNAAPTSASTRRAAAQDHNEVLYRKKELLYDTDNDQPMTKFARYLTCQCLAQRSTITTEQVQVKQWKGCHRVTLSMDIDNVKDIQLRETCGPCLLLCGRGDIRIYGQDSDQKDEYFTVKYVENAGEVFLKLTELVHKINDLKFGMKRPDDPSVPHVMYSSRNDSCCIKCTRTMLFGCLRPTTVITKPAITQSRWKPPCNRITKRLDMDNVEDIQMRQSCLQMCCGTGTLRIYGQDEDQTEEYFDISWVGQVKSTFKLLDNYHNLLNNRDRVGFEVSC